MLHNQLHTRFPDDFSWEQIPEHPYPRKILLANPREFTVVDVKNPYMEGQEGRVDKSLALRQWERLRDIYLELYVKGIIEEVKVLDPVKTCEDFVFAANQTFPWKSLAGDNVVVLSRMKHHSRQREVPAFEIFFSKNKYQVLRLPGEDILEGMGDSIPVPGKRMIISGYGHRTSIEALEKLAKIIETPILGVELVNPYFYHLDTCFIPVNTDTALAVKEAFSPEAWEILSDLFTHLIPIPAEEARTGFGLNAHLVYADGKPHSVIIQKGNPSATAVFRTFGLDIIETDTSEFMKSGGSVFCMKMMFF